MKYRLLKNRNLAEDEEFLNKEKWFVGYNGENRAEILEFEIPDTLNDYAKKINFDLGTEKVSDILNQNNTYILKNNITQYNQVSFYLEFVKEIDNNTTEILKTEVKTIEFGDSFDVNTEITEEEISIIDTLIAQTNSAINRANAISQDLENKVATDYYRGATGENGADAKINGVNTLSIEAGTNITLEQEGNTLTINSTASGGTSDYTDLTNKPSINNVTLSGNKSLNDLGIQPEGNYALVSDIPTKTSDLTNDSGFITGYTETDPTVPSHVKNITQTNITNWNSKADRNDIPDVSNFITRDVNDLLYYYTKTEVDGKVSAVYKYKGTVATYSDLPSTGLTIGDVYNVEIDGSNYAWTGTVWDKLGGDIDLSGYQTKITSSNKISADLISDGTTNKTVTSAEKNTWNNKQNEISDLSTIRSGASAGATAVQPSDLATVATSGDYNDLTNRPTITGKEDKTNKVTSISASSTDTQYPSAKCVYDIVGNIDTVLARLTTGSGV